MNQTLYRQFHVLRASIESQTPSPAVLLISSALPQDGASDVALGLARALAEVKYATAIVSARPARSASLETIGRRALRSKNGQNHVATANLERFTIGDDGAPLSATRVRQLVEDFRRRFDFAIIEAGEILPDALPFARHVNGVVLSVRVGRVPSAADQMAVDALDRAGAKILGVVAVDAPKSGGLPIPPLDMPAIAAVPGGMTEQLRAEARASN